MFENFGLEYQKLKKTEKPNLNLDFLNLVHKFPLKFSNQKEIRINFVNPK